MPALSRCALRGVFHPLRIFPNVRGFCVFLNSTNVREISYRTLLHIPPTISISTLVKYCKILLQNSIQLWIEGNLQDPLECGSRVFSLLKQDHFQRGSWDGYLKHGLETYILRLWVSKGWVSTSTHNKTRGQCEYIVELEIYQNYQYGPMCESADGTWKEGG